MENFIVSARKYRPITFDAVVGQATITNTLRNAIRSGHLAQAFLFCGPRGVGKTTCARILAKTINCMNLRENIEPCNECESCKSFNQSHSFNIHELDAASNNSVDDIRNLADMVRFAPQVGKYSIYIIDEVHMLSASAFNAFLKTLEEPPAHAKFILATTEKHKIIPTILSRCQVFDFRRITVEDIVKYLEYVAKSEGVVAESDALHVIAQKADGALRDALSIFDQIVSFTGNEITYKAVTENLNVLNFKFLYDITEHIRTGNLGGCMLLLDEVLYLGFDGHNFVLQLAEHFRNLLVCKDEGTLKLIEAGESIKSQYQEQSKKIEIMQVIGWLDILNKCDVQYAMNRNKRLLLEIMLMQICTFSSDAAAQKNISHSIDKTVKTPVKPSVTAEPSAEYKTSNEPKNPEKEKPDAPKNPVNTAPPVSATTPKINISKIVKEKEKVDDTPLPLITKQKQEPFSEEDFLNVWNEIAQSMISENPSFHSFMTSRKPVLKENFIIEIQVENKVQQNEFDQRKVELLGGIRNKLNNYKLTIEPVIVKVQTDTKPYTNAEKFKRMAEKNPAVNQLKKQLDLEMDY